MGNLPTARNTTYVPGVTPVKGNDLNDLQDCVIGRKSPITPFPLPAGKGIKISGAATYSDATGLWTGIGAFLFPLPAIPGTKIESVQWGYNRGNAGTMSFRTREMQIVTGAQTSFTVVQVGAGNGYTTSTITAADLAALGITNPIGANKAFSILIEHDNAANILGGLIANLSRL